MGARRNNWRQRARYAKIKEIKDFIRQHKQYPSCTFTMTKREFNFIASALSNHFDNYRVSKRTDLKEPFIELTISN